jgi:hypothetical protein
MGYGFASNPPSALTINKATLQSQTDVNFLHCSCDYGHKRHSNRLTFGDATRTIDNCNARHN